MWTTTCKVCDSSVGNHPLFSNFVCRCVPVEFGMAIADILVVVSLKHGIRALVTLRFLKVRKAWTKWTNCQHVLYVTKSTRLSFNIFVFFRKGIKRANISAHVSIMCDKEFVLARKWYYVVPIHQRCRTKKLVSQRKIWILNSRQNFRVQF